MKRVSLMAWLGLSCSLSMLGAWAVEPPPASCSGTPAYKLAVQVSLDGGSTWLSNSGTLYLYPYSGRSIMARTLLTVTTGQTQGWSFSLEYDNSYQSYYGGSMSLSAVTTEGTQTMTVQNGGPPDVDETAIRSGYKGYTQGIVIDTNQVHTLSPASNFVTSLACFYITASGNSASYPVYLKYTHAVGSPNVRTVITQGGQSTVPCAQNFTLTVYVNPYQESAGGCSIGGSGLMGPEGEEEILGADVILEGMMDGMGGAEAEEAACLKKFKRGDSDDSDSINIGDAIFSLQFLFLEGQEPGCLDAMDINDDGRTDISDPIYTLAFLFIGGPGPPPPGNLACGVDPTEDELGCKVRKHCCGSDLPPFLQLSSTTSPSFTTELMATKDVQLADFDLDGDLDVFVPHSRGGPNQPDLVYINRINEAAKTIEIDSEPVNQPENDHDGMGNGLCHPEDTPPCRFETTYASLVVDIGGPGGTGPDGWPDIITVNGADFMRVLINQQAMPGNFPNFIDEGGRVILNEAETGWIADVNDPTSRIYNCQSSNTECTQATDLLGPLISTEVDFDARFHKQVSLDDIDVADIDLDGDLDLFLSNRDSNQFAFANFRKHNFILRNNGSGKFDIFEMYHDPKATSTHDSAFGDYDEDGDPDLLNANDLDFPKLWRNRQGEIETPENPADYFVNVSVQAGIQAGWNSAHAAFVDLNNDGKLDIHLEGQVDPKVYWNNGGSPVTFSPCPGLGLYHAAYADMNGDLWTDIVGADGYRGILFLNSANCVPGIISFQESRTALPGKNHPTWHPPTYGVALGDLDGDGDVDIVFGQGDGGHSHPNRIFLNTLVP